MQEIILFGASGNIGQQALYTLRQLGDKYNLVGISVGKKIDVIPSIYNYFNKIKYVVVKENDDKIKLEKKYPGITFLKGDKGLQELITLFPNANIINAISGFAGLQVTLQSLLFPKRKLFLANKESLVLAGKIIQKLQAKNNCAIYPIDSEHCAIFQCLERNQKINEIILTASGGPYRELTLEEFKDVDGKLAYSHPNWKMGEDITIDSATMMNKALEIIEAYYLFNCKKITVVIHPESIIHSAVQYEDFSIKAQLSVPNMVQVLGYFLNYPVRSLISGVKKLDFSQTLSLNLQTADVNRWKALGLAYKSLNMPNSTTVAMNAANEMIRTLFKKEIITFGEIIDYIDYFMNLYEPKELNTYQEIKQFNDIIKTDIKNYFVNNNHRRK